ncbi:FG-GAP repeat domain-containing protein [Dyadobacter fermentans]|uniref:FG-GAP repeat-containing protein n=1 Tax=Dyadobacter fermentans (strain ATCC 700827 / DSM 18053 / CIP 107007 / KCTC 52180 / NS114) TaxID=471854 RepID=C6VSS5_DYAFD|nr:VCBS repeat-containing protein [Dyadobacter fermentans]ACT92897.1 FG-GAP repeat-containing protein [Dyadobacter fermentans DSM 18053]
MKYHSVKFAFTFLMGACASLSAQAQQKEQRASPIVFEKKMIASESVESVGVADVDNDGKPDLISGEFWYKGPEFFDRYYIAEVKREREYWDDFATIPMDVNGDGNVDFITGGWFNKSLIWRENPGNNKPWKSHEIDETGNVETARAWDIDQDGYPEIIPNNPNLPLKFYKLDRTPSGKGQGKFTKVQVADKQGHGLGFGDINGDGRGDLIISSGWLEAPKDIMKDKWILHSDFTFEDASVPMIVADVNGDSKNDIIVGQAHSYGLDWYEQTTKSGAISWIKHTIDPFTSQYHTMDWVDLDGDGKMELVTGKRYRAHNGGDPGEKDMVGLYYFQWNGEAFVKQTISHGPYGDGKGIGVYFSIADLNGDNRKDIIVAGKDGLCVFFNRGNE